MRILVTGGCGFIGSNFIHFVLEQYKDIRVINLDKLTYCGNPENLSDIARDSRYSFVAGDICDKKLAGELAAQVDAIINFAAETHVDRSIKYPDDFVMTNVIGVKVLLEAARKAGISRFVQIGTDEIYGSVSEGLSKEDDPLKPNSPYSATKAAGDLLALSYHATYGLPVVVVRSSNNFGPYQYPEKVIPLFITNLLRGRKVPLYGDGGNVRDWLFVKDNCEGIDLALRRGHAGQAYNIGGGSYLSNLDLAGNILSMMGKTRDLIEFVNDRPGHDRRYALDSSRIRELGWTPAADFAGNLEKTVRWYEENEAWWQPLRDKAEIIKW
ncbi:MAG: dTDP-glucose 4,6-dehydratase [Candidatus Makaraimicrobium thalassicum]|nr:MAG: dTDP-glucose 4,6-dehydratase [Candidatus Omnitrophota bacterium]